VLKLRRATVLEAGPGTEPEQQLVVDLAGQSRAAIVDVALLGVAEVGDEVVVNAQAQDLRLGSGGFDVVHVNLTRGLDGDCPLDANVMKLNYTSLQHTVAVVGDQRLRLPVERPVAVLALHGQLAAVAWAFAQSLPGRRLGYVQTEGGALPGGHSRTVRTLRERGLLAGHLTAGASFGGDAEAVTCAAALHYGLRTLGWDAALCGPGPGIVGSASPLGHGGMAALDSAHVSLALGCRTLVVARMSSSDGRERHRGISHHTLTVLDLLLEPVTVALPAGMRSPVGADLASALGGASGAARTLRPARSEAGIEDAERPSADDEIAHEGSSRRAALRLHVDRPARITRHDWRRAAVNLPAYVRSGLSTETMGRTVTEDPLFFGAALAGGGVLAELAADGAHAVRASAQRDSHEKGALALEAKLQG
jgi:Protein of unknown function (DUF3866)